MGFALSIEQTALYRLIHATNQTHIKISHGMTTNRGWHRWTPTTIVLIYSPELNVNPYQTEKENRENRGILSAHYHNFPSEDN
jgi:hypothetical protein